MSGSGSAPNLSKQNILWLPGWVEGVTPINELNQVNKLCLPVYLQVH